MKPIHKFFLVLTILVTLLACTAPAYIESRIDEIRSELQEETDEAQRRYFTGEITLEEKDRLISEARERARNDAELLPEEARRVAELEKDQVWENGADLAFNWLDLLLLGGVLGGAGLSGRTIYRAVKSRKPQE